MTESVQVEAAVPLVQTDSSELGATVNETQVKELPLNGRDFVQLTRLIPGVSRGVPGANNDGAGNEGWRMSSTFVANGMRTRDNNFLLDGVDNNELNLNTVIMFPSVDAIEEFKVQTSTYSAEFGRANGGVVNLQIKSGTNEFHGSGFDSCAMTSSTPTICSTTSSAAPSRPSARTSSAARWGGPSGTTRHSSLWITRVGGCAMPLR